MTTSNDQPVNATDADPPAIHSGNPWVPTSVVMAATVMVVLDTTIVNVALHEIGVDLGAGDGIEWVVTAYLLAVCASQPATGWLADRFGRKQVFLASVLAFTIASGLCAMAPTLGWLVAFRVLQGLGGGAMMPVGMAIVLGLFPKERHGRALSVWGMAAMVAPAIGPTLGGWLVTEVSWHWLFLINVPIGLLAFAVGLRLLPQVGHREHRPFDGLGLVLGSTGITIVILGISEGGTWGWTAPSTLACIVGGVSLLTAFIHHELNREHPLIELRMFSDRTFSIAMGALVFIGGANYARLVFVPLQLEGLRGYTALHVGMMFIVPALVTAIGMSIGGRLVDRLGPRTPSTIGCTAMAVAMLSFSQLTLTTPTWMIVTFLSIQGLGMGMSMAPLMVAGLSELPSRLMSQGTAVRSLASQLSGAVAVAILGAVVVTSAGSDPTPQQSQDAYNQAFLWAAAGVLFALFLTTRLPRRVSLDPEIQAEALLAVE